MQSGDLVKHTNLGVGLIVEISNPTVTFPYQIALVQFVDGHIEEIVTTILQPVSQKEKNTTHRTQLKNAN